MMMTGSPKEMGTDSGDNQDRDGGSDLLQLPDLILVYGVDRRNRNPVSFCGGSLFSRICRDGEGEGRRRGEAVAMERERDALECRGLNGTEREWM
jgi:hypothetical protein